MGRTNGKRHLALLLLLLLAAVGTGCGGAGQGAETDPEKGSDAEILNQALARELAGIQLYNQVLPRLSGPRSTIAARLRAHAQEYASGMTKAIRGLGGDTEVEALELDLAGARSSAADLLRLAYEHEAAALSLYVEAAPRLHTDAPSTLAAAAAAGHAQHLVVLRRALGASAVESIPDAFDVGEVEPPGAPAAAGEG